MKIRTIVLALFAATLCMLPVSSQKSVVDRQKEIDRQAVDSVKNRIDNIKKDLIAKNKKFRVDVLEITKYKISQITGLSTPTNVSTDAKVQKGMSKDRYRQFLRKLKEQGLLDEYYESFESDDDSSGDSDPDPTMTPIPTLKPRPKPTQTAVATLKPTSKPNKPASTRPSPSLPMFTWVDAGKVSPIKYQGTCGSCWTFAAAAVFESSVKINYNEETDLSEQSILDCSKNRNGQKAGSCETGGWYGYVFDWYQKQPIMSEARNPYKGKNSVCISAMPTSYYVATWSYVKQDASAPSVTELKKALAEHGPVAACVKVTEAFQAYAGGIFDEYAPMANNRDVNHAITIVGWDDSKKAWLIKNSWGTQWGEKGYMWIEYGCNNIGYGSTWAAVEKR